MTRLRLSGWEKAKEWEGRRQKNEKEERRWRKEENPWAKREH